MGVNLLILDRLLHSHIEFGCTDLAKALIPLGEIIDLAQPVKVAK